MARDSRLFAILELGAIFVLWVTAIWSALLPGGFYWQAGSIVGMVFIVLFSLWARRPGWSHLGFRLDNFASSLVGVGLVLLLLILILAAIVQWSGLSFQPLTQKRIFNTLVRGVLQEAFFLGFLFNRWNDLLCNPRAAVLANAISFSFIHLPNPFFVFLTCAGGIFFGTLFLRFRNVWVLGLAHGVLGLFVASAFRAEGFLNTMTIGPAQLAPLAQTVSKEWAEGDRFGMGSHDLIPAQFGNVSYKIEKVSGHFDVENDETNKKLVTAFLTDQARVFCVIMERDYDRLISPGLKGRLFVLGDERIWKRRIHLGQEFWSKFLRGNGGVPVLGAFRERVLLISNKAPVRSAAVRELTLSEPQMSRLEEQLEHNAKLGIRAVPFPEGPDWFNVSRPLQMSELKGKVVLLDFWTFCCINCMHVIPELKRLEKRYPDELAVIGVHSAKFSSEKDSENIRQSVMRYEVRHPVINDSEFILWQAYGVHAWPTLVLIDPEGHVALTISGEGHFELLNQAVQFLIRRAESKGIANRNPLPLSYEGGKMQQSILAFPGKVFADQSGLVISDSNHNRILVTDFSGHILEAVGRGSIGRSDGDFTSSAFHHPQGVFRDGQDIYVADTENHLIRHIDLNAKTVKTIAGTGKRGGFIHGKLPALQTSLNSPWDLIKIREVLYIAMAGAHQIWSLDLKQGVLDLFVASGREDIADGRGSASALAQPSGITFDGKDTLYFADSEVSAVRSVHLPSREVITLIGKGLFEFGDQDGAWEIASLQHPLGVAYANGFVFVADTYNDKIKTIDIKEGIITTVAGTGEEGFQDGTPGALYEPGGLATFEKKLYIADTNNHAIRVFNLDTKELTTLALSHSGREEEHAKKNPFLETIELKPERVSEKTEISIAVDLPEDHEFTEGTPLHFKADLTGRDRKDLLKEGELEHPARELPVRVSVNGPPGSESVLELELDIPYCTTQEPKLCKFKSLKWIQPVSFSKGAKDKLEFRAKI